MVESPDTRNKEQHVAKKKTQSRKPEVAEKFETPPENVGEHGNIKISDVSRMNILRLQSCIENQESKIGLEHMRLQAYVASIDPGGKVRNFEMSILTYQQKLRALHEELKQQIRDLEEKHGIDMQKCSFDDETGTIHQHEEPQVAAGGGLEET